MATQTLRVSVQIDNEIVELTGEEAQAFIDDREAIIAKNRALDEAQAAAKQAILDRLGLTAEEAAALLA